MTLDRLVYSKLLEVLSLSEKGDTATQRYVQESLAAFEQNRSDVCLYYLEAALGAGSFHVKQMALLLLKKAILQGWAETEAGIQEAVKREIIGVVNLREVQLRNMVASCYVSIFTVEGYDKWPYGIENLLAIISAFSDEVVVETAVVTLNMILEDSFSGSFTLTPSYINYLKFTFVPRLFQITAKQPASVELVARILLVLVDSNLMLEFMVRETFSPLWNLLGTMAGVDNYNVKKCVLRAMLRIWDLSPAAILNSSQAVFPFVTRLCSDEAYTIQIDALDFYTHLLQSIQQPQPHHTIQHSSIQHSSHSDQYSSQGVLHNDELGQLSTQNQQSPQGIRSEMVDIVLVKMKNEFGVLLSTLVDNTRYSSWDYMSMDRSHLEDDNANIPDDMQDVPVKSREDEETNTWGNTWTVRKGSALLLDTISQLYCQNDPDVVKHLLALIQAKLESGDWEVKESGVLALGAISKGALYALFPYLPKVLEYLVAVARDVKPLLRIIACWCLSRFVEWVFLPENGEFLHSSLAVVLHCMVDRNKRVQESACSAFTSFEECGGTLLLPFVGQVLAVVLRCLETYQARNFMILYDVIGTLYQNVGDQVAQDPNHAVLLVKLLGKLEFVGVNDVQFVALMECLGAIVSILGSRIGSQPLQCLTRYCLLALKQLVTDVQDIDFNHQVIEVLLDTLSILLTSNTTQLGNTVNLGNSSQLGDRVQLGDTNQPSVNTVNLGDNVKPDDIVDTVALGEMDNIDLITMVNELASCKVVSVLQSSIALMGDLSNCRVGLTSQSVNALLANVQYYLNLQPLNSINSNTSTNPYNSRFNSVESNTFYDAGIFTSSHFFR